MDTQPFSLNHLTDTQFEEFCFDLLNELGFLNVKWRKGTGLSTSPSDRGRDIQCQREEVDIDGHKDLETWFIECKHSIKGVPPDRIQAAFAWATAERPDRLLLIASTFFSNPCHDYVDDYVRNNHPYFKIRIWQKPDLERMTAGRLKLLRKYDISGELPLLSILHPAHLSYIRGLRFNTLKFLFEILDKCNADARDKALDWAFFLIIQPRFREPVSGKEKMIDRMVDEVSYDAFKRKCIELVNYLPEFVIVSSIVNITLQAWLGTGDTTSVEEKLNGFQSQLHWSDSLWKAFRGESEENKEQLGFVIDSMKKTKPGFREEELDDYFNRMRKFLEETIQSFPERVKNNYDSYVYFCEHIVKELLIEDSIR